ncbi:nucleoside kinase [Anaerotalea alkaliphila]|uniref:Nucleoside kinase n=1 Tax=Anaerotalea alkaliphila TaxID=2662126 RepID=A0A7X5KKV8_9FIRM|nr:nucleoside kinase [Anaerotalea alkaliphila]NDL66181.1 nucleoside kinase [Anaerotalea alkaliphila]
MKSSVQARFPSGVQKEVHRGTILLELAEEFAGEFQGPIVLALVNGQLKELDNPLEEDADIEFLDTTNQDGYRTYQRSLSMLFIKAVNEVLKGIPDVQLVINFAINEGLYCVIKPFKGVTNDMLVKIRMQMDEMVRANIRFKKSIMKTTQAMEVFRNQGMMDKAELFKYRRSSHVNLYELKGFFDNLYGYMAPSTGCIWHYELHPYDEGFILQYMSKNDPTRVAPFHPDKSLFNSLKKNSQWGEIMGINNVGELNSIIANGEMNDMILVAEALMEKQIGLIADEIIHGMENKRLVFIAGPSSSGKTTFAHRLSIQLRANGVHPHIVSVDNYFVDREKTPRDEEGNYDFETLEAIDLEAFNQDMLDLMDGKQVDIPEFNFITGRREYLGKNVQLKKNGILVVEGIHCLNPKLSRSIPDAYKYKIYISALTALNIDNHNRISTTDARLVRRLVRDSWSRGADASRTITMWPSVRRGEDKFIFPYQMEADMTFNSSLIYELAVLKQYVEPLLFSVPRGTPAYLEAKRLVKFFEYFLGVTSETVPRQSLLREFIGGNFFG